MASIFRWGNSNNETQDLYSETIISNTRMKKMSADKVLTIPAVKASIELITGSISQLPIFLYEGNDENQNGDKIIDDEREKALNLESNSFHNAQYLKKKLVQDYLLHGCAYLYKANGELHYLDSSKMKVEQFTQDRITISRREFIYSDSNVIIPEEDLIIIDSGNDGVLYNSAETFNLAIAQQEINLSILNSGALPTGVLKATTRLTENAIKRLRESWQNLYQGSKNSGKTIILEEGLEFSRLSLGLDELQMSESQKATLSDIARVFNIPESLINSSANKYDSLSKNNSAFLQHTISPILVVIESALNRALLTESEKNNNYKFKFDTSELLRTTEQEKVEVVSQAFSRGLYTYNQAMKKLDLPQTENDFKLLGIGHVQVFDNNKYVYLNHGLEEQKE